jgi:hypothetical protein
MRDVLQDVESQDSFPGLRRVNGRRTGGHPLSKRGCCLAIKSISGTHCRIIHGVSIIFVSPFDCVYLRFHTAFFGRVEQLRLSNLSWLMRFLTESLARFANREDKITGRFWEGRFKMQRLLDEWAVAAYLVSFDRNPIRAGITTHLSESQHTSMFERLAGVVHAFGKSLTAQQRIQGIALSREIFGVPSLPHPTHPTHSSPPSDSQAESLFHIFVLTDFSSVSPLSRGSQSNPDQNRCIG